MKKQWITFALLIWAGFSLAQFDLHHGLVAHYPFNGNAQDESGNGYHAEIVDATLTTDRFGREDKAYYFDGNANVINFGNVLNDVFTTNTFTVSAWFNAENLINNNGQAGMLISKWNSVNWPQNSFILYANNLRFVTGGNHTDLPVFDSPETGVWNMLTVSMDDGNASIYLNGEFQGLVSDHDCYTSTYNLLIGNHHNPVYGFHGAIDDVRIYDRPMSQEEVEFLYHINLDEGLVAHYSLNGNTQDESGNEHHGTDFGVQLVADRHGTPNSAYSFNGSTDYIQLPNIIPPFKGSLSYWFKTHNPTKRQVLVYHSNIASDGFGVGPGSGAYYIENHTAITANGYNYFVFDNGQGSSAADTLVPVLADNWYHVVLTYDTPNFANMYVNGELVFTRDLSNETATHQPTMTYIGRPGANIRFFEGVFDELRVYDRLLNEHEILTLYNETLRAEFAVDITAGFAPLTVNFQDSSLADMEITSWQWDFNNNGTVDSEEQNPEFTFEAGGVYDVRLTVSDGTHTHSVLMNELISVYDLDHGLTRHYEFSGNAFDESGNEQHGEVYGAQITDRYGIAESAYAFDGQNNVTVPSVANWGEQLTITFWFYAEQTPHNQVLFGSREGSSGATLVNFRSVLHDDATVSFQVYSNESGNTSVISENTAQLFAWNHVICEIDLVRNTETIILNGVETSRTYDFSPRYLDEDIGFGNWKHPYASSSGLNGKIDEVRIYDRVLLQKEKDILINQKFPMADYFGAIAIYPFNNNALDVTGNEHHGTVHHAMPALDRFWNQNSAWEFTSNESRIEIGSGVKPASFPIYLTLWVKPDSVDGIHTLIATDIWGSEGVFSGTAVQIVDSQIHAGFGTWDGAETSLIRTFATQEANLLADQWTHIAVGFHAADDIRIFINGVPADGDYEGDATDINYTDYGVGVIGNSHDLTTPFSGVIDDVHIYGRHLYAWEVEQMVNEPGMSVSENQMIFVPIPVGEVSVEQVFAVYGRSLLGNINIQAPEGFTVSLTTGSGFGQNLSVPHQDGMIDITPVFVRFEPAEPQQYTGNIIVSSEGLDSLEVAVMGSIPTIIETKKKPDLKVFPNPFSGTITIRNSENLERVVITNMAGQTLLDLTPGNTSQIQLNMADFPSGFYILICIDSNGERIVKKLLKH